MMVSVALRATTMAEDQNQEQDRNRKARGPPAIAGMISLFRWEHWDKQGVVVAVTG